MNIINFCNKKLLKFTIPLSIYWSYAAKMPGFWTHAGIYSSSCTNFLPQPILGVPIFSLMFKQLDRCQGKIGILIFSIITFFLTPLISFPLVEFFFNKHSDLKHPSHFQHPLPFWTTLCIPNTIPDQILAVFYWNL